MNFWLCELSGPVRDTPPYRPIPFRDSIAEGGTARFCLVFIGYRASIAEIPPLHGGIAPPLCMSSKGETLRKGGGGIAEIVSRPLTFQSKDEIRPYLVGVLRGNTIRGNTTRNSERKTAL